ncbi:type IV secretion system protein VirB10 [Aliivibrio fischeri]|uniref:type IV secretion system protein VirB10 n=1 Tax=Aliivibrio fischeri TaxID=668 RepID=UPI0007C4BA33|nr:type IV secretion system protein VirB10 [Aliivibrio fischeri]MCE7575572.1 type IV secretion system protein VirB10 [Aliivibrio fischeri]
MTIEHLEGEELSIPSTNSNQRDKKHVLLFFIICGFILSCLIWFIFFNSSDKESVSAPTQPSINTSTHKASTPQSNKTFEWKPSEPSQPEQKDVEDTSTETKENIVDTPPVAPVSQPLPPNGQLNSYTPKRTVAQIDKSKSSMSSGSQGSENGLQLTPPYPTYPSVPTTGTPSSFFNTQENDNENNNSQRITSLLNTSKTENSVAAVLYNRDYLLAKGAYIDCVLNTSMNSTVAGMTKCTLTRDIYSDNGNTLLIERGSEVTGEYRANLSQGQARLFVLWDRVKTPHGVIVDLASPATDSLGAGGVNGYVDTHFWERFGGAMMLSLVDDLAGYMATNGGKSINNFENSSNAAQDMAAEALKNTINIPPTFYKNQGERIGIFIARDIDFSKVYRLKVQ